MPQAMVVMADGFEEIEAISIIGVLRRAKIKVLVTGLESLEVTSCRGINVMADALLADEKDHHFDIIILPGGEPGCTHLQESTLLESILRRQNTEGRLIGAICSAPRILAKHGLLKGINATSFPTTASYMTESNYQEKPVVVDGLFITGRGPAIAMKFALGVVEKLCGRDTALEIKKAMLFDLR
ncbi:DJ-1/PfpI family protein [bacterium]|nr:DJ-1/PfpI family protein [bacterium]